MNKLVRITTVPLSLEKLLEGQLTYMNEHFEVIAVSADPPRLARFGSLNGVRTFHVDLTREITPMRDVKAVLRLYRFLKKEKPLIVHTHTPKAGIVGMLAAKLARVPVRLHTVAGLPLLETTGGKRKLLSLVEKMTYRLATKVFPNSYGLKKIIVNEGFSGEDKLEVLGEGSSNGIDLNYFDPQKYGAQKKEEIRKEWAISSEDLVFIFVGRLVSEKGINELVKAFDRIHQFHKRTSLLLVGPFEQDLDPLQTEVLDTINNHPKIFCTGYQQDVRPFLSIAHILTFPSYREGFPNVVMQAGAMNLPAIVTDINGCNELIEDGENGLVIPVKDSEALFEAMKTLLENALLREAFSARARPRIAKLYERGKFWKLLLREYKKLESEVLKS